MAKTGEAQPSMPSVMPGEYVVKTKDGQEWAFKECLLQIGTVGDAPGSLALFHMTGSFTLAVFAPGEWLWVRRLVVPQGPERGLARLLRWIGVRG